MGPEVVNKSKNNIYNGDYVGRDNITVNIVMFQDSERKFLVTHDTIIKPVAYFTGRETELQDLNYIIDTLAARHTITVEFLAHLASTNHWTVRELRNELVEKGFQLEYIKMIIS